MSIKGIIFDFDGTLFDSMSIWETAGSDYLATLGITAKRDLNNQLRSMSLMQSAKYLNEQYSLQMTTEEIMSGINKTVEDFYLFRVMPKNNVDSMLTAYQSRNIKMCIATATDRYLVEAALKRCGIFEFIDNIFTCTEIGYGKDKPDIFDIACSYMRLDKFETVVFEDAYHAAYTAKKAGYTVIGIYDRYEKQTEALKRLADVYISSFSETDELLNIGKAHFAIK